ncbi:hypothetical protein RB3359 [Rhodopirellula baltica SH 1]|uniref:Uncharacterized protein n=2 Tax=Rhodopirellula baltica TaxID=265606 RepID=Q7UUD6_RHOBA|nr:hypothetical protein RB3359 [Rhodopirellula baltica SH 1]
MVLFPGKRRFQMRCLWTDVQFAKLCPNSKQQDRAIKAFLVSAQRMPNSGWYRCQHVLRDFDLDAISKRSFY